MAPRKLTSRDANTASKVLILVETDDDPASPLHESSKSNETGHHQRYKSWTPAPSIPNRPPRDEEERTAVRDEYLAWARKHFGERWYELDEARESEKDHLKDPLKFYDMFQEMKGIENKKRLEHEREKKAALGRAYVPNWFIPLSETDSDPASPLHDSSVASDDTYHIPFSVTDSDKSEPMPEDPWERLEYARRHLHLHQSEEDYQEARAEVEIIVEKQREENERKMVEEAEEMAIRWLANTDPLESERLLGRHTLRYMKVLTDDQIDYLHQKEAAARERGWYLSGNPLQSSLAFLDRIEGRAQEQIDAMVREEAAAQAAALEQWKPPMKPLTQEELDAQHRTWDAWGVSKEEHAELVRMFGLQPESEPEPDIADAPASERVSQPRASSSRPPKHTSRKTHSGRVTKSTAQIQNSANRGTRSRQTTPTAAEGPMPDRQSKRLRRAPDKPVDNIAQVPPKTPKSQPEVHKERASGSIGDKFLQSKHHITRQRKVYKKDRASQRLVERSVAPQLHETPVRNPSNTSKPNSSGSRNHTPLKKRSTAVKGTKPQGISKSQRKETNHKEIQAT